MSKDKIEEFIAASKLNEILRKKDLEEDINKFLEENRLYSINS